MARAIERVALGAVMGAIAFVLERRLLKSVRGRGHSKQPDKRERGDVALSVASKDVDQ